MIPEFQIDQDNECVSIAIRVPYLKVTKCEFYIEPFMFKFYLKPYLLSLDFEQELVQAEEPSRAVYDHDRYILKVFLKKKNYGEEFLNLNLLSSLLSNAKSKITPHKKKKALIEVVEQEGKALKLEKNENNIYAYGFCGNYDDVFNNLDEEMLEVQAFNPRNVERKDRYSLSRKIIDEAFDESSYMFDKLSNFD